MYMPSTSTLTNELSGQVHRPTLLFANTSASCQLVLHRSREEEVEALHLTGTVCERTDTAKKDLTEEHTYLFSQNKELPSKTEETMTLGQRGTYTITFNLHSACIRVCVLGRDIATFFSNVQHTCLCTFHSSLISTWEYDFSSWHTYMQSIRSARTSQTEGKGSTGRKMTDVDVCAQMNAQTGSWTLAP